MSDPSEAAIVAETLAAARIISQLKSGAPIFRADLNLALSEAFSDTGVDGRWTQCASAPSFRRMARCD